MFLYRDPVKNILSILSLNGSMPKFITRRFMSTMKNKLLSGLSPDAITSQKALADLDKGLEEGDDHMFGIIFYTLHILCYLKGKDYTDVDVHTIKYENIIANPREQLENIVRFLSKDRDAIDYSLCLEAMNRDSQEKSEDISKEKLASFKKKNPITKELIQKIDDCFQGYGLPSSKDFDYAFR